MKKRMMKLGLGMVVTLIVLTLTSGWALSSQDKPIKLLFGFFEPPQGPVAIVMKEWAEELEKKTNGRVDVTLSLGGALGKPGEFLNLAAKGVCDVAACVPAYGDPGNFPMTETFGLPYNIPSGEISSKAMVAFAKKGYLDKEFSGVKRLSLFGAHGDILVTKKKLVTSLADLRGLKLWNTMPLKIETIKLLGATPVALPPTELYSALQKGIVDGAFLNFQFLATFKLSEILRYSSPLTIGAVAVATVMNKKTWNNLPADIQGIIDAMSDEYSIKYGLSFDAVADAGRMAFAKEGGKTVDWKPGELAKVNERISPVWEDWIVGKEKRGLPARQAVNDFYNIVKGLGVEPPASGYSPK